MTLDNMTGITEGSYTGFCKSQLITCNFVKACNGVCPFEDALKHADKMQTMNVQHTVDHDRDWIIGCIEHDGFIHTHRFDKANQIIHDALSAPSGDLISRADAMTEFREWVKRANENGETPTWNDAVSLIGSLPSAKLNNPCNSLLTDESNGSKEHKSKLDLISRADAIKAIRKCKFESDMPSYWYRGMEDAQDIIKDIPSADAVHGEWIMHIDDLFPCESTQECSVCHAEQPISISDDNFCPNCGARMKGGAK